MSLILELVRQVSLSNGCDTPQIYIGYPGAASQPDTPKKVLRAFQKTCAKETSVTYTVTDRDVSNWDTVGKRFAVTHGVFDVYVGSSSQDIHLTAKMTV